MNSFLQSLAGAVFGILSGFDRLMFQGHLRELSYPGGMSRYCDVNGLKLTAFAKHAEQLTDQLVAASQAEAKRLQRPIEYLSSAKLRKEDHARAIAQRDGIRHGLIAVFSCVEPCWSFALRGDRHSKRLTFRPELRKCLHLYHYYQHPQFGLVYGRVQSWFPFTIQIGCNGREWLARQLDEAALNYQRHDNCISWVEDVAQAQTLLDAQLRVNWAKALKQIGTWVHPVQAGFLGKFRTDYYWSLKQSEWASDVLFVKPAELQQRYGSWLRQLMADVSSADVLRFLGRKVPVSGQVRGNYTAEVLTDLGRRVDGLRIKHRAGDNSIKMYDKAGGRVLRVETTINNPSDFKVYRAKENDPQGEKDWRVLRAGVADIHRRAQVSQASNERYFEGLAAMQQSKSLQELVEPLGRRVKEPGKGGRKLRALSPLVGADAQLLEVIGRPEFMVNGLRNRDVVAALDGKPAKDAAERKRRSAQVSRQLRLLRGHGLIKKVSKSHRYQVTERGREILTALHAARHASTEKLVAQEDKKSSHGATN
jgi:hypothetical protein